jgi:hypothetical protein
MRDDTVDRCVPAPMRHLFSFVAFTLLALAVSVAVLDRQATEFLLRAQAANGDIDWRVDAAFFEWLDVMAQYPLGVGLGIKRANCAYFRRACEQRSLRT